jgi:hypothetical protein
VTNTAGRQAVPINRLPKSAYGGTVRLSNNDDVPLKEETLSTEGFMAQKSVFGLAAIVIGLPLFAGCSKKESDELITLKGRIEKVRRTTDSAGELSVRFFSEKQNQEIVGTAVVGPETRIEKNGNPASLKDLEEGTLVKGQVRVVKEAGQRKFNAVLIQIESPKASSGG